MKKSIPALLAFLAVTLGLGFLSGRLAGDTAAVYESLTKPPLSPPGAVFGIVWAVLYALMAIAAWRIWRTPASPARTRALQLYAVQLLFNFFWSILFFRFGCYGLAFGWLGILLVLVVLTTAAFWRVDKAAGIMMLPYILWLVFAGYLNLMIALLN